MNEKIIKRLLVVTLVLAAIVTLFSCGKTEKTGLLTVAGEKYTSVKVYSDVEDQRYAEALVDAFACATDIPAAMCANRDEANVIITNETSELGVAENEWGISAKSGVVYLASSTDYGVSLATDKLSELVYSSDGSVTVASGTAYSGPLLSKEDYLSQTRLVIYPEFPAMINRNYDYKVSVTQGSRTESLPVYNHTMEYHVSNRSIGGDLYRRFSTFAFSGEQVRVDIKVNRDFESYSVLPSAKNFKSTFKDGVISVYLDKPEYFMIRLDSDDNSIMTVFADLPEFPLDIPKKDGENVYYIEGWQQYGSEGLWDITTPNTTVYIAPGAVLNNRVKFSKEAVNGRVIGRGAIVDPYENIYEYNIKVGGTEGAGYKLLTTAERALVDGIHMLDARCFNIATGGKYSDTRNVKILATMMNTDGITIGGSGSVYENIYMHVGDNGLVISGCADVVFKNITIGTTCAAIFPQVDVDNALLEDIYIFRTNDGVINHVYNGNGENGYKERRLDITFRNFDCIDCLNIPHLIRSGKMGTLQKYMYFENVNLPSVSGVTDPHAGQGAANTYRLADMQDTTSTLVMGNTYFDFLNLYIDGTAITSVKQVRIDDAQEGNEFIFKNDGTYTPASMNVNNVNYTAKGKVFIGTRQISFKNAPVISGSTFTLNSVEILKALNSSATLTTATVTNAQLVSKGIVKSATVSGGNLYITPLSTTSNILLPDEGEISHYSEHVCYAVDMVVEKEGGDTVYYMHDYSNRNNGGISRMITNEIKMYGKGQYTISFDIKASNSANVDFSVFYDDFAGAFKTSERTISATTSWTNISVTLNVNDRMIDSEMIIFYLNQKSSSPIDYFALKNITLKKVS